MATTLVHGASLPPAKSEHPPLREEARCRNRRRRQFIHRRRQSDLVALLEASTTKSCTSGKRATQAIDEKIFERGRGLVRTQPRDAVRIDQAGPGYALPGVGKQAKDVHPVGSGLKAEAVADFERWDRSLRRIRFALIAAHDGG